MRRNTYQKSKCSIQHRECREQQAAHKESSPELIKGCYSSLLLIQLRTCFSIRQNSLTEKNNNKKAVQLYLFNEPKAKKLCSTLYKKKS